MNTTLLNDYIATRRTTLERDHDIITSMYRTEKETATSYNGRQLLELLQNADDAESKKVRINIDTDKCLLEVSNIGLPFDEEGIKSIMLANKSSKSLDKAYIGNKGLGFRSVLSWATEVEIATEKARFHFSKTRARQDFETLIRDESFRLRLAADSRVPVGEAPFPMLALPLMEALKEPQDKWITIIRIKYAKQYEGDILEQVKELRPEVLLFLNHIRHLELCTDGKERTLTCVEYLRMDHTYREIDGIPWRIADSGDKTYPEAPDKLYRFKLAYRENLADDYYRLFTYFPTKVLVHLPFLIHATFDLDPARNGLNETKHNRFLLRELANFIGTTALATKKEIANWQTFRMLKPTQPPGNNLLNELYAGLEAIRKREAIYPCVDGQYRTIESVKHYGAGFSEWIGETSHQDLLPELLLADADGKALLNDVMFKNRKWLPEVLKQRIDTLSAALHNLQERKELIGFLLDTNSFAPYPEQRFSLFVDEKGNVISSTDTTFTPVQTGANEFHIPSFVGLRLMSRELYNLLAAQYRSKFIRDEDARAFKSFFDKLVNIQPYDSAQVFRRIIGTTRDMRKRAQGLQAELAVIKEAVQALYKNFCALKNPPERFSDTEFPLLTKAKTITEANTLWLSSAFPSGVLTEQLYAGILRASDYVASAAEHGLEGDKASLESFFIWLGVTRYVKLESHGFLQKNASTEPYIDFLVKKGIAQSDAIYSYLGDRIAAFNDTVGKLSPEHLLLLALSEYKIGRQLELQNEAKLEMLTPKQVLITSKPTYIAYQIEKLGHFATYLADDSGIPQLNKEGINPAKPIFLERGFDAESVRHLMHRMGAKLSFNDLSSEQVYLFIARCGSEQWPEAQARKLYQLCFNYFRSKGEKDTVHPGNHRLLARKGMEVSYVPQASVYYSDNATLPTHIAQAFWILEFPKRRGEDQTARYFGIKTFKDLRLEQSGRIEEHSAAPLFQKWIERIKPYLLAYRLMDLSGDTIKKAAASALKSLSIVLVAGMDYAIDGGEAKPLTPGEFIQLSDGTYYLCAPQGNTLDALKTEPAIGAAFAEILCVLFRVNESYDTFQAVFNDSDTLKHTKYQIQARALGEHLEEANQLLGVSKQELDFWSAVVSYRDQQIPKEFLTREALRQFLKEVLAYLPSQWANADFELWATKEPYQLLKEIAQRSRISPLHIHEQYKAFPGLQAWHYSRYVAMAPNFEKPWANAWWIKLSVGQEADQATFQNQRLAFNRVIELIVRKLAKERTFEVEVDYQADLLLALNAHAGLELDISTGAKDVVRNQYAHLLKKAGILEGQLPEKIQSLLFFEGHEEAIQQAITDLSQQDSEYISTPVKDSSNKENGTLLLETFLGTGTLQLSQSTSTGNGRTPGTYNGSSEAKRNSAGAHAERLVRDQLVREYTNGEVQWLSRYSDDDTLTKDDGCGYDIRYRYDRSDPNSEWFFVEVKSAYSNSFIISRNEVQVGLDNKERYQLAIVQNGIIYLDKQYFLDEVRAEIFRGLLANTAIRPRDFDVSFFLSN